MWPRNDGTFVAPNGQNIPQQTNNQAAGKPIQLTPADIARLKDYEGTYDDLDELDVTDSEFDEDSEFDYEESDPENEAAAINAHLQQNAHNVYAPASFNNNMPSVSASEPNNYNALSALSQFASAAPGLNMQSPNVTASNHSAVVNALSQLASVTPGFNMQGQNVTTSNHNAVSALGQLTASVASTFPMQYQQKVSDANHNAILMSQLAWQHAQQQSQMHGSQMNKNQGHHPNNIQKNGHQIRRDQNGNEDDESDDDEDDSDRRPAVQPNLKHSTPSRVLPRSCSQIRPRNFQISRREAGVDLFQIRRREFEETFITDDSASSSPIRDLTAKLKHLRLRRPNFLKFFQRNKHSTDHLVTIATINQELRDPSIQAIQAHEGKSQLDKILKPSDTTTNWTNTERIRSNSIVNHPSSYEKSIQAFLFRSNFPEHFLGIRLQKLSIEEVQQLIRQIDLLENVQDKLTDTVRNESLSGAALMSCDLIDLRKSLDLNLGHWTIFEQLITGLRNMQNDDFLKLHLKKPVNVDGEKTNDNPVQTSHSNVHDDPSTQPSSSVNGEVQQIDENKKVKICSEDAIV